MAQGFDAVPASDDDDGSAREARLLEQIEAELRSNDPLGKARARRLMGDLLAPYVQNIFRWCVVRTLSAGRRRDHGRGSQTARRPSV